MVQRMALAIGGTLVAPTVLLESCSFDPDTSTAGPERLAILDAIAETIIPRTATAGARDARIGAFIDVMIRDCYYPDMQEKLNAGIQEIAVEGKRSLGGAFEEATQMDREAFLGAYDAAAAVRRFAFLPHLERAHHARLLHLRRGGRGWRFKLRAGAYPL